MQIKQKRSEHQFFIKFEKLHFGPISDQNHDHIFSKNVILRSYVVVTSFKKSENFNKQIFRKTWNSSF